MTYDYDLINFLVFSAVYILACGCLWLIVAMYVFPLSFPLTAAIRQRKLRVSGDRFSLNCKTDPYHCLDILEFLAKK